MTGQEALGILNQITEIHNFLIDDNDRSAFLELGRLMERLSQIARIDECSFNPTNPTVNIK